MSSSGSVAFGSLSKSTGSITTWQVEQAIAPSHVPSSGCPCACARSRSRVPAGASTSSTSCPSAEMKRTFVMAALCSLCPLSRNRCIHERERIVDLVLGRIAAKADTDGGSRLRTGKAQRRQHMAGTRSGEHTSELQSLMRISYAVCCLKKKKKHI